jgi:hypothetical protein
MKAKIIISGVVIGLFLAIINYYTFLGLLGAPIALLLSPITVPFMKCSGEACWGPIIIQGSLVYAIIIPLLFVLYAQFMMDKSYKQIVRISLLSSAAVSVLFAIENFYMYRRTMFVGNDFSEWVIFSSIYFACLFIFLYAIFGILKKITTAKNSIK